MSKLNSVVNRQTIMNNKFSDVRFVPTDERYLQSAGHDFITLWYYNDKNTLEIVNNLIYNVNDPSISLIQPLDTHTVFVVGTDQCLYCKVFDFDLQKIVDKKDFTLKKEPISFLKLQRCEGIVTDIVVVAEKTIVCLMDEAGWFYKLQYSQKGTNILAKLQTKFSVKDNKGMGLQGVFS